jgi:TonB family protein
MRSTGKAYLGNLMVPLAAFVVGFPGGVLATTSTPAAVMAPAATTARVDLAASVLPDLEARANDKDQDAELCLGDMYLNGDGVPEDMHKAEKLLDNALNQGKAKANVFLLELYYEKAPGWSDRQLGLMASFFSQTMLLAKHEDTDAETYLGYAYLYGYSILNISPDVSRAIKYFKMAAAQGDGSAQAALASIYAHGWDVKADPALGKYWRQKAGGHTEDCPADMNELAEALIHSNMVYPDAVRSGKESGSVVLRLPASGGVVTNPVIVTSSGHQDIDAAVARATSGVTLPVWKNATSTMTYDVTVNVNAALADLNGYIATIRSTQRVWRAAKKRADALWSANPYHSRDNAISWLSFSCKDGKSTDVKLVRSSGDALVDEINEKALSTMGCPKIRVKKSGYFQDAPYRLAMSDPWDNLYYSPPTDTPHTPYAAAIRKAIADAEKIPQRALIVGTTGTGVTGVSFDVRNGKVTDVRITQSSGDSEIDKAAVRSVLHAPMPKTPKQYVGRTIHIQMHVNFMVGSASPVITTPPASSSS